jgi:hypothetical protein
MYAGYMTHVVYTNFAHNICVTYALDLLRIYAGCVRHISESDANVAQERATRDVTFGPLCIIKARFAQIWEPSLSRKSYSNDRTVYIYIMYQRS